MGIPPPEGFQKVRQLAEDDVDKVQHIVVIHKMVFFFIGLVGGVNPPDGRHTQFVTVRLLGLDHGVDE